MCLECGSYELECVIFENYLYIGVSAGYVHRLHKYVIIFLLQLFGFVV